VKPEVSPTWDRQNRSEARGVAPPGVTPPQNRGYKYLINLEVSPTGLAFERSHTILGLRGGVHTPSGGVNTAGVHTGNVVFTHKKWCSHSVLQHIPEYMLMVGVTCVDRSERF
jgi:hypothetical protein